MSPLTIEEQRRLAKATSIADVLERAHMTADALPELSERGWKLAAWQAQTKPPSNKTKEMVATVLATRERVHSIDPFLRFQTD